MDQAEQDKFYTEQINGEKRQKSKLIEFLESVVIAVILAVLIRIFVFSPFYIPSGSMEPTLQVGDRIIVSKISYRFTEPHRGDIMVFKYPLDPERDFVKRVIGIGGDVVLMQNNKLYINGDQVNEEYLPANMTYDDFGPLEIAEGHYFMVGDNRNNSDDSRNWGLVSEDKIVGKAVIIYWPVSRIGLLN